MFSGFSDLLGTSFRKFNLFISAAHLPPLDGLREHPMPSTFSTHVSTQNSFNRSTGGIVRCFAQSPRTDNNAHLSERPQLYSHFYQIVGLSNLNPFFLFDLDDFSRSYSIFFQIAMEGNGSSFSTSFSSLALNLAWGLLKHTYKQCFILRCVSSPLFNGIPNQFTDRPRSKCRSLWNS